MNREVKFRAFYNKKMWNVAFLWLGDGEILAARLQRGDEALKVFPNNFAGQIVKFRQYTGLKDKNGVEIYEGDILKTRWLNGNYPSQVSICPNIAPDGFHYYSELEDMDVEVIGNIYENPELSNQQKQNERKDM